MRVMIRTAEELENEILLPEDIESAPIGTAEAKQPRKKRSDAGRARGPQTTKKKSRVDKSRIWLTEVEADYITQGLTVLFAARYGLQTLPPTKEERGYLAGVLRKLETFPPFAFLQNILAKIIPMADPDAKPGGSLFGDLTQYCYAWHSHNPELAMTIYYKEPIPEIPILPKRPPKNTGAPRVVRTEQVSTAAYQSPHSRQKAGI
jgi:hypothetical protein